MSFAIVYGSGTARFSICPVCNFLIMNVRSHARDQKDPEHLALYVMES